MNSVDNPPDSPQRAITPFECGSQEPLTAPKGGLGIVQSMSAPGFEPATERGRNTVMIGIGNQRRDWARMAEQTLGRTIDKAMGVAGPLLGKVASPFEQSQGAGLAASIASPATQRGMGELANQARAAEQQRSRYLELERQRERARKRDIDLPDM